jgi:uncharacterized membrane protein
MSQNDTHGNGRALVTTAAPPAPGRDRGLRSNAFSAGVMLLVEYGLGMWVNLYAQIPPSDHGKGVFAAFGAAVARGPLALTLHALLGTLLLVTAITFGIRAVLARKAAATVIGALAFLAITSAWLSGARFVGASASAASAGMAMSTAVALLCYLIILFVPRLTQEPGN